MRTSKNYITLFICMVLLLSLFPPIALASEGINYPTQVWVNGKNLLIQPNYRVECGNGYAQYTPSTHTLLLNNANITKHHRTDFGYNHANIFADGSLNINLVGKSTALSTGYGYSGIVMEGRSANNTLTLKGSGTLYCYSDNYSAIVSDVKVIMDGATVVTKTIDSRGVRSQGLEIHAGTLDIMAWSVGTAPYDYALYLEKPFKMTGGNLYINSNNVYGTWFQEDHFDREERAFDYSGGNIVACALQYPLVAHSHTRRGDAMQISPALLPAGRWNVNMKDWPKAGYMSYLAEFDTDTPANSFSLGNTFESTTILSGVLPDMPGYRKEGVTVTATPIQKERTFLDWILPKAHAATSSTSAVADIFGSWSMLVEKNQTYQLTFDYNGLPLPSLTQTVTITDTPKFIVQNQENIPLTPPPPSGDSTPLYAMGILMLLSLLGGLYFWKHMKRYQ